MKLPWRLPPWWLWVCLLLAGLLLCLHVYRPWVAADGDGENSRYEATQTDFGFYRLLPQRAAVPALSPPAEQTTAIGRLQAGAFLRREKAENQQKRLQALGFVAHIEAAEVAEGQWYRVYLGDYQRIADLRADQQRLRQHSIPSLHRRLVNGQKKSPPPDGNSAVSDSAD